MTPSIFITGTDHGLGLSLTSVYASRGYRGFAGRLGEATELHQLAERFDSRVVPVAQDVTSGASIEQSVASVSSMTDQLDLLINCAGICPPDVRTPIDELDLYGGWFEKVMNVNAFGPVRVTQAFLPLLRRGTTRRIVMISSEAGSNAQNWRVGGFSYSMSKAALNRFSKTLHHALKDEGFRVLVIHPGWLRTKMSTPDADLDPDTPAAGIYDLSRRAWGPDEHIYVDYMGKRFEW